MAKRLGWYRPESLTLKVTLDGSKPKIWRRVRVDSGLTLDDLHYVIQVVFGWTNSHLHHFLVPPDGKLTRRSMASAVRYHTMPPDPLFLEDGNAKRADEAMLGRVFTDACDQLVYEYDFGDSWTHVVKLESRVPSDDPDALPVCLGGEYAGPGDDVGGIGGYYEWLDALKDPSHEWHADAIERFGEAFDPTAFDADAATRELARVFRPAPKKAKKPRKPKQGE